MVLAILDSLAVAMTTALPLYRTDHILDEVGAVGPTANVRQTADYQELMNHYYCC